MTPPLPPLAGTIQPGVERRPWSIETCNFWGDYGLIANESVGAFVRFKSDELHRITSSPFGSSAGARTGVASGATGEESS